MLTSYFSDPDLKKEWILFENDLLNHGFVKDSQTIRTSQTIIKYIWTKKLENVTIEFMTSPIYFKKTEIDISFIFVTKIHHNNKLLIENADIYYVSSEIFNEICKKYPIIKT